MAKVRFRLKEPYKNGNCPIHLILEYNKQIITHSIGLTVPPQYWDSPTQRVKRVKTFPHGEFNKTLQDIETSIDRVMITLRNDLGRFPTKDETKKELNRLTDRNQTKPITLFEFFDTLILERKKDRDSKNTSQQNETLLTHLKDFCKHQKRTALNFADINHNFLNHFKSFAYEVKNLNPNSFSKYIGLLKTAMREAEKRGLHQSRDYQFLKTKKVQTHEIYLNEDELGKIYKLDLTNRKGHEAVRDLFIIGCFTGGQRFSDWAKLQTVNIFTENGKQFFRYISAKTQTEAVLPLNHSYVQEILERHKGVLPKPLTNQKSNEYLKEIGQLAGIDTPTKEITYPKGIRQEKTVPKYNLITTHTARRSLATNLANRKCSLHEIRLLTGHATEKQLQQYLKTSSYENAVTISESDFFNE